MHCARRSLLALAALTFTAGTALAQAYPNKPITMVVPTATGGTTDLSARMLAQALTPVLGQSVVVDNKGGGNGAIAAGIVKRAPADGYTLLMQYSGYHVISPHLTKVHQWEQADFQPVANVISAPQIIVVREGLPVKTLAELIAYAKANPGKLNYASSGNGSLQHVTGAMLEQQGGIKMVHVPYKGTGPALQDLLGGQVDLTFGTAPPFMPHIQAGKLRVLGVANEERTQLYPDAPTLREQGLPTVVGYGWYGMLAPAGTPADVVTRLHTELKAALADPDVRRKAEAAGLQLRGGSPAEFSAFIASETRKWAQIIQAAQITAE
jgi:tripartite-type tricarboxylate transporter receptor subunit TctC